MKSKEFVEFVSYPHGAILPIVPCGLPMKYHGRKFQRRCMLVAPFPDDSNDMQILKVNSTIRTALQIIHSRIRKYQYGILKSPLTEVCTAMQKLTYHISIIV
jgi:hypothetical protein